uniref:Peroxidase n=1 Tax=Anthurium amnicola TaxID=1678845 RepID=A0A1D1YLW9_9ARAE
MAASPPALNPRAALLISLFSSCVVSCLVGLAGCSNATRKTPTHHPLSLDFYAKTCPQLDQLVSSVTSQKHRDSPIAGPATIRLFFHDCFVSGCDASVLISPGPEGSPPVERDMPGNRNLAPEAFETVNKAKALVESRCPGVVSCADILAVAARDFVHLAGGPYYPVKKGRRDSRVSLAAKVRPNLPRSNSTMDELIRLFAKKGLGQEDLVALSGAHTIGFSHCDQFVSRLYDYGGSRRPDPNIDPRLLKALQMSCPRFGGNSDVVAPFDVQTPFAFDHMYYGNLEAGMGLLATDQALFLDARTRPLVQALAGDKARFFAAFAAGMDRMGSFGIKRGRKGEVRRDCTRHVSRP